MGHRCTVALAVVLAFSGCTCRSNEPRVAASIDDGPIAAKVVEVGGSLISGTATPKDDPTHASGRKRQWETSTHRCELVVTKPKSLVLDIGEDCFGAKYTLTSDAAGRRLAFRSSKPGAKYEVVYFGEGGRSFGPSPVDGDKPLAWDNVATLDAVLAPIFRVNESSLVMEEVRARRGDAGLADFLVETADAGDYTYSTIETPCSSERRAWFDAATSLPATEKRRVADALVARLHESAPPPLALVRATLLVDLDRDDLRDDVERIAERGKTETNVVLPEAFALALLALAKRAPERAARLGCYRLTGVTWQSLASVTVDMRAAFAAIGAAGYSCNAMTNAISRDLRDYCRYLDPPSDAAVVAAKALVAQPAVEHGRFVCAKIADEKAILTAAVAASKEASAMEPFRTVARRSYALRMPSSPRCVDLDPGRAGAPCWIDPRTPFANEMGCDPAESEFTVGAATIRVDNEARALVVARSARPVSALRD